MNNELDNEPRELSDTEQAAVEAAFNAGVADPMGTSMVVEPTPEEVQPAAAPAAPVAPAPKDEPVTDPFAGLPAAVRDSLARLPGIEQDLHTFKGRVSALQSELARARQAPAAPAPAPNAEPENPALELVRGQLPEVADAIEEVLRNRLPKTPEAAPAPQVDAEAEADLRQTATMNAVYPGWDTKMNSTEFGLWLGRQAPDVQRTVATTNDIGVVVTHLRQFDQFQSRLDEQASAAQEAANRKSNRLASSVAPSGARRAPASAASQTEEEAFEAGYRSVRTG